jgi:hypothetical protein
MDRFSDVVIGPNLESRYLIQVIVRKMMMVVRKFKQHTKEMHYALKALTPFCSSA